MCVWNAKSQFFPNKVVWRLGHATWLSCVSKLQANWMANWKFCPVMLQLAWLFSFSTCFTHVHPLATCMLWESHEIQLRVPCWVHNLELFFTLSHTLPLHDSHLNTGFLNVEIQANWHKIKPTKWLIKFNLTIFPFGYFVTKPYNKL